MDTTLNFTLVASPQEQGVSPRVVAAQTVEQFDRFDAPGTSCSEIARRLNVPDSTLRHWLRTRRRRMRHSQWPGKTVQFLESPDGLSVLHRMITAAHLIFVQANDCGIRNLCAFLELSGLDEFIASSYGAQQTVAHQMESLLVEFGEEEDQRLGAGMPPREISVAVDETFHPDICLVGMEPVSNFIFLEQERQQARTEEAAAGQHLSACQDRQQRASQARRGLSHDDHPFDLNDGRPLDEDEVGQRLAGHFDTLEQIAAEAGLSERATKKLAKARRVLEPMKATIFFFWKMLGVWFSQWDLPEPVRQWMRQEFIPGFYLARVAEKASDADERHRLRELSQKILARARSPDGLWGTLSPEMQADVEAKAQICADLFQRSSSCVEGRNGQLSLKHHALHRFTLGKLQALTVLHNYLVRRADGTTAAERFYGTASRDLFAWLLDRLSIPARPRVHRCAA